MRFLILLLVAVSASADCNSRLVYRTADYIVSAKIDGGALYVSLLLAGDIERIDLGTGARTIVSPPGPFNSWDVQNGLVVTAATIGRPDARRITLRDGYIYWLEDDAVLRRMIVGSRTVETVAEDVTQYSIFEDRVVFISGRKLFWKQLNSNLPPLFLTDADAIGSVNAKNVLVTKYSPGGETYEVRAAVERVSWTGVVEKIYDADSYTYHNPFTVSAVAAGDTTYVIKTNSYANSLVVIRNGVEVERAKIIGVVAVLDAGENTVTFAQWGSNSTGLHEVVELCAVPPRSRVVR